MSKNKYRISEKTYADDRVIFVPEHKYDIKDVFKGQVWQCIGINDCKSMAQDIRQSLFFKYTKLTAINKLQ